MRAVAVLVVAVAAAVVEFLRTDHLGEAGEAAVAAAIAVGVAWLALTLPGTTRAGALIGGSFVVAGILTWTSTDRPILIWAVLGIAGIGFAIWSRPWIANLRALPRAGAAWTGLAYWPLGVVGALLVGHWTVGAQRAAYAGVFTLAALALIAVVAVTSRDPSIGVATAVLLGIAALLLAGSGSVFDAVREVPDGSASAAAMRDRFWGGHGLFYQPNALAGVAVIAAIRIAPDRAFALWQRLAVTGLAGMLLVLSNSRTGLVLAAGAALVHAVLVLWRRWPGLPDYRRRWVAIGAPFLVLALVVVLSGGADYLTRNRFSGAANPPSGTAAATTSGRTDTWRQVGIDWQNAGIAEKLFGDATTSRAVVTRLNDGAPPEGPRRQLNTDNAAVGAFRRAGVFGALAFLVGIVLLVAHALRRRAAWFTIAVFALLPTIATEDWLLGGTNGVIWILLLAGEVYLLRRMPTPPAVTTEPAVTAQPAVAAQPVEDAEAVALPPAGDRRG